MNRKTVSSLALAIVIAFSLNPVLAASHSPDTASTMDIQQGSFDTPLLSAIGLTDSGRSEVIAPFSNTVVDLGTNSSVDINWTVPAKGALRSAYNYKTGSGKITLRVKGSRTATVVFYLYDSTDTKISTQTVEVVSSSTIAIPFTNLFTNREYYIYMENSSQSSVTLTGTIASA